MNRLKHPAERGAIAVFAVVVVLGLFLAIGLVVDGGGKIRAMQRANALAAEAARTGAQAVVFNAANTSQPTIDVGLACQAAYDYLVVAGAEPTGCHLVDNTTLQVDATVSYDTVFLSLMGRPTSQGTGSARAHLARGIGTEE